MSHESDAILKELHAQSRELREILLLVRQGINIMVNAEGEVPENLRRFANYMHDVHDIKYMYEEHGSDVPEWIQSELRRLDDRYRQILNTLNTDGGAIEKIRREMAADKENRYNHTKHLPPPKPKENGQDETRSSE